MKIKLYNINCVLRKIGLCIVLVTDLENDEHSLEFIRWKTFLNRCKDSCNISSKKPTDPSTEEKEE